MTSGVMSRGPIPVPPVVKIISVFCLISDFRSASSCISSSGMMVFSMETDRPVSKRMFLLIFQQRATLVFINSQACPVAKGDNIYLYGSGMIFQNVTALSSPPSVPCKIPSLGITQLPVSWNMLQLVPWHFCQSG